jgi:hypothetical protein
MRARSAVLKMTTIEYRASFYTLPHICRALVALGFESRADEQRCIHKHHPQARNPHLNDKTSAG